VAFSLFIKLLFTLIFYCELKQWKFWKISIWFSNFFIVHNWVQIRVQIRVQLHVFFRVRVELKERGLKWQKRVKLVASMQFVWNFHFCPSSFQAIRYSAPIIFKKYILVSNLIFFSNSFLSRGERGLLDSSIEG